MKPGLELLSTDAYNSSRFAGPKGISRFHKVSKESWEWNSHHLFIILLLSGRERARSDLPKGRIPASSWANKTCSIPNPKIDLLVHKWNWMLPKSHFFNLPSCWHRMEGQKSFFQSILLKRQTWGSSLKEKKKIHEKFLLQSTLIS